MTSVAINRIGTDQVSLQLLQTGSSETSCNLRHALLDDKLSYMFTVEALSVPLNKAPINPVTVPTELFRVLRRNQGLSSLIVAETNMPPDPPFSEFLIQPNQFFDVSALVRTIANWARGFNRGASLLGLEDLRPFGGEHDAISTQAAEIAPLEILQALTEEQMDEVGSDVQGGYPFLTIELTSDAALQIVGHNNFWNNYVIQFSAYGAALLGYSNLLENNVLSYTGDVHGNAVPGGWVDNDAGKTILVGNIISEVRAKATHPIYQSADQRVKIAVQSHLPIVSNMSVIDEVETVDRTICEKYFENKLETSILFNDSGAYESATMKTTLYSGQFAFIKKSDLHTEWMKLMTALDLRFFRFYIYITYRVWDTTKNRFRLSEKLLDIPETKYWGMTLRFVSEV